MAYELNGQPISVDSPFTAPDGTKYANLRDPAIRAQLGIVEVTDAPTYDQRFYWGVDNPKQLEDVTETPEGATEPVTSKGLKSQWIAQVKDTAGKLLSASDWMIIRKAERDVDVPAEVAATRAAIVAETDRLEAAITACTTVEELIEVVSAQNWPSGD